MCSQAEPVRVAALFHYLIGKGFLLFAWITDTGSFGRILDFICRYRLDMITSKDNDKRTNLFVNCTREHLHTKCGIHHGNAVSSEKGILQKLLSLTH